MTDAIVVGAGHNGLVCAAYLARGGLDVLVLEARDSPGGCASTVDAMGARVNICNCDHTFVRATGIIEELGLAAFGLRYVDLVPSHLNLVVGEQPWFAFHDVGRTLDALRLAHPGEVDNYRHYLEAATPVARLVQELTSVAPTAGNLARRLARRNPLTLARLLQWSRLSAERVLRGFFSSDALVAPAIATGPAVWGVRPSTPGTGLGALGYAMRHLVQVGRPVGGSGSLPAALTAAVVQAGGRVRTGARVASLCCEGDRVRGVQLTSGELVEAPVVVSTADPRTTVVAWLSPPPPAAAAMCGRWARTAVASGYEAKLDAVIAARPTYAAVDDATLGRLGVDEPLVATAVVTPPAAGIASARDAADAGTVADQPVFLANVPSVPDPSVAPVAGGDVFSLEVLFTPYDLAGGWDGSREPARWLEVYGRTVLPGFIEGVRASRVVAPPDYERDFNLVRGHAPSFPGGPLAALAGRARELSRYETPVRGLYLSGAGTFPGAGIWGASGRNAARVVLSAVG
ncbi:MAG TPA: NAD(P)/FAD-dependent oxidoreductase [Acidimicrobiales bacterium]|nr:NAD(P)/FAD-dependent oxidoreductase [Acidimicrobiales bacterium]